MIASRINAAPLLSSSSVILTPRMTSSGLCLDASFSSARIRTLALVSVERTS